MAGFIHDKLDTKLLVLYIMARAAAPIDFDTLTDLAMCDPGVDYFQFAESLSELTGSGHLSQQGQIYAITDKGRRACSAGESSLSPVIRQRCDQRLAPLNQALKRKAQVRAQVAKQPQGFDVHLTMNDDKGCLFSLTLLAPTQENAQCIADGFLAHPERVYNRLLDVLLTNDDRSDQS